AVVVDGVLEIYRRHHLRLAELTGPRSDHVFGPQIAALDQPQRVEELGAKAVGAPAIVSQRSERAQRLLLAHVGAEIAFQRPERDDDRRRHAVLLVDPREYLGVSLDLCRTGLNAICRR